MVTPAVIERLTPRQGKVLRYVVSTHDQPVSPSRCVITTKWSDLPHSDMQARKTLSELRRHGLVKRLDKDAYEPTDQGREVIAYANKEKLWQQPPPPKKTNKFLHRKEDKDMTVTSARSWWRDRASRVEKFNKVRHRLNKARKLSEDYKNGAIDGKSEGQKFEPFHLLSFRTADDGRFTGDIENVFGACQTNRRTWAAATTTKTTTTSRQYRWYLFFRLVGEAK